MSMTYRPDRRWRNALLATALVAAAAFVALGIAVAPGPLPIDRTAASALLPLHAGPIGALIDALDVLGSALLWDALVAGIAVLLWVRGRRAAAVVLLVGLLGAEAMATVAKLAVDRGRPAGVEVTDLITQASYPSGHVVRTVVTAGLLVAFAWPRVPRSGAIAAAVAGVVAMGVARIAAGEHWFTDVVGAVLLGIAVLAVIGLVVDAVGLRRARAAP
jgi:undecaprenyl-diphosphatase